MNTIEMKSIDSLGFFDGLAASMNAQPARFDLLGDLDMDLAIVMFRTDEDPFTMMLGFRGINCETVASINWGEEASADCWLAGDLACWKLMFTNIAESGLATGEWTLNTLTILGDDIGLHSSDPMGWDKFHRFNQTLQEFFDNAAALLTEEATDVNA